MMLAAASAGAAGFRWLLFGHLAGLAVLGAGLGGYVVGLHRLTSAGDAAGLESARPMLGWGEHVSIAGYGLLVATGIGLGLRIDAFDEAWLLTSLGVLAVVAIAGRYSGVRLTALYAQLAAAPDRAAALLPGFRGLAVHLPADGSVVGVVELVYLMTLRPGGLGIAISLGVAAVGVAGAAWALRRNAPVGAVA